MAYMNKKLANQHNWSAFPSELLDLILQNLSFGNKFRFQGVCSSWLAIAKTHISYLIQNIQYQTPLLMLPNQILEDSFGRCLYNLEEKKLHNIKNFPTEFNENQCIGSSKGWLVFLDKENENLYLFNPVLGAGIKVDNFRELPDFLTKVALWSDPIINDDNNYGIAALYGSYDYQIAYVGCGDNDWSNLDDNEKRVYYDIVSRDRLLYTLSEGCLVEAWDFSANIPRKVITIHPSFSQETINFKNTLEEGLYINRFYLVESQGKILLVERYIGNHVRDDGLVVHEADMIDHENEGCCFRYLTKFFHVFKLDFNAREWVKVENLGDGVIFLGGNDSVLVQARDLEKFEKNSIYFTDDDPFRMNLDDDSGGHDTGKYNLKNRSVELFFDSTFIKPPPFWVILR